MYQRNVVLRMHSHILTEYYLTYYPASDKDIAPSMPYFAQPKLGEGTLDVSLRTNRKLKLSHLVRKLPLQNETSERRSIGLYRCLSIYLRVPFFNHATSLLSWLKPINFSNAYVCILLLIAKLQP